MRCFSLEPRGLPSRPLRLGYTDAFRSLHREVTGKFTWADYFRQAFEHNRGIWIIISTVAGAGQQGLKRARSIPNSLNAARPSDHTPVVVTPRDAA